MTKADRRGPNQIGPKRWTTWAAVVVAALVIAAMAATVVVRWAAIGDTEISGAGWVALGLGVVFTLALGIGLMALVFFSNRRGYDEPD